MVFLMVFLVLLKSNLSHNNSHEAGIVDKSEMASPVACGSGTSGSRAGLFRTPISGGVQSATSAHDLPPPALAVRNLMEQVRLYLSSILCFFPFLLVNSVL